jgi:hypothetical protein
MKTRITITTEPGVKTAYRFLTISTVMIFAVLFSVVCTNQEILKSKSPTPVPTVESGVPSSSNQTVEKEVEAMQTADFNYIFVLRRRDGGVMDMDDKAFLRQATGNVNRRTLSDDGKAIIIGSNAKFPPELLQVINERFELEDHSKPESQIANSNTRSNANIRPAKAGNVR